MEKRTQQIETGAGLTESRLNTEFVDFLRKYSSWMLFAVVAVVAVYYGINRLSEAKESKLNEAFEQFEKAKQSGSPVSLIRVAEENSGQAGVGLMARISAADILAVSAYRGIVPGAEVDNDGAVKNPQDVLTAEKRDQQLKDAAAQYQIVIDQTERDPMQAVHAASALFGLAGIAESRGQWDEAVKIYQRIEQVAKAGDLPALADVAKARQGSIDDAKKSTRLYAAADIVTKPKPKLPTTVPDDIRRQIELQNAPPPYPPTPMVPDDSAAPAALPVAPAPSAAP